MPGRDAAVEIKIRRRVVEPDRDAAVEVEVGGDEAGERRIERIEGPVLPVAAGLDEDLKRGGQRIEERRVRGAGDIPDIRVVSLVAHVAEEAEDRPQRQAPSRQAARGCTARRSSSRRRRYRDFAPRSAA
jgi:hypothetical protein